MRKTYLFLLIVFILGGCMPTTGKISIDLKKKESSTISSASVSSVHIVNNQLIINGAGLTGVANVKVNGNSFNENFTIESHTATKIIANAIHGFSFDVSKAFSLILSDASASATFQIDFSLCNATLGGAGFDCTAPTDNDVLTYDQASSKWVPKALTGLSYKGVWDANTAEPVSTIIGQYYIVNTANLPTYNIGDWIVWDGSNYDIVAQSAAGGVSTVFGRPGAVVAAEGDYNLDKLLDVNLTVAPTTGQVLKYDGAKWIADDEAGGGAGSVTTTELADGSVTDAKIAAVAASKITGTITSAQITDATIVNADISATAAIAYSKLSIPALSIPYAQLNIADGDIPAAKISGLPSATAVLATAITDGDTTHAPDGNIIFDTLAAIQTQLTGKEASLPTGGTAAQYFAGNKTLQTLNTAAVPESGTNYYFTDVRTRAATLTGLASASGSIAATDTVLGAFGKLLGTQGDYVSKSANTTVLGKITIDNTVGELHVPTLPTTGGDLTQAANAGYVENYVQAFVGALGQWIKNGLNIGYTAGNVGIGTTVPTAKLNLAAGTATASTAPLKLTAGVNLSTPEAGAVEFDGTSLFYTNSSNSRETLMTSSNGVFTTIVQGWYWDNAIYSSTGAISAPTVGVAAFNANSLDGTSSSLGAGARNTDGNTQTAFFGVVSTTGAASYTPSIVIGQQTGSSAYAERMRIDTSGNVGIGTSDPQAKLTVAGAIASTPPSPFAGATVNLATSNTQVLTNVGQTAITLTNMVHGGSYTLIIQDTTSRIYTFTGCTTSKFQPANIATITATHTIYNIMTVYNGANYDCYITWSSGYN